MQEELPRLKSPLKHNQSFGNQEIHEENKKLQKQCKEMEERLYAFEKQKPYIEEIKDILRSSDPNLEELLEICMKQE